MRVWSVLGQKGGSGKTTLVLHLAIAAISKGRVVSVVDLDSQRSAEQWSEVREKRAGSHDPPVVHGTASNLGQMLEAARATGTDLVLVDTPPAVDRTMILAAAAADLIIVPSRASILDHLALKDTLTLLKAAHALAKVVVVFNAIRSDKRSKAELAEMTKSVSDQFKVPVVGATLEDRADFSRSLGLGKGVTENAPRGPAARELQALFRLLCQWERKLAQRVAA